MFKTLARAATLTAAVALSGCATTGSTYHASGPTEYCREHPEICILIGAVVVGGVILVAASAHDDSPPPVMISDARLKTDLRYVQTLPNGIKLHSFRYLGSDQVFVGAVAQELLADAGFAKAVKVLPSGYYAVDYGALGLSVIGADPMQQDGARAVALAP